MIDIDCIIYIKVDCVVRISGVASDFNSCIPLIAAIYTSVIGVCLIDNGSIYASVTSIYSNISAIVFVGIVVSCVCISINIVSEIMRPVFAFSGI